MHVDSSTVHVRPSPVPSGSRRWGKAPPVEPFNGESEAMRLEDWLPTLERAATWNDWTEEDRLLQLAGHLRGRALQEWELISETDKGTFSGAVQSLKSRLDRGSKTLAAQDFRHTVQSDSESVADYIRRLQRNFRIAYGRDGISAEARDALLYGQLHEGLHYEVMKAPGVSGVDSYSALCIAAKSEERRLQELRKRQQYHKVSTGTRLPVRPPLSSKNASRSSSSPPKGHGGSRGSTEKCTCFVCDQLGHIAINCPKQRKESKGRGKPPFWRPVTAGNSDIPLRQVQAAQKAEAQTSSIAEDPLSLLLSDSEEEQVNLVQIQDKGSSAKGVVVQVQGVPAAGVIDSGSDITIMGAELFAKVAVTARLHKRDLKKADRIPRMYDQRTFSLDGWLDLDIEFDGKSLNTPVYLRKEAQDQLLLSEGVSRQLGIISYHRDVHSFKQLVKDPHSVRAKSEGFEAQVPLVRVHLVQVVSMMPHQSMGVTVRLDGSYDNRDTLMVEPSCELSDTAGVCLEEALINASNDGFAYLVLSNTNGVSCQIDENSCIGVVHEVALVDPGTQTVQVPDGPTVSRVETGGPDRGLDANQRILKLLATVKKSELI